MITLLSRVTPLVADVMGRVRSRLRTIAVNSLVIVPPAGLSFHCSMTSLPIFQISFVPLVPIEVVIVFRLRDLPNVEGFVHDDETHSVGQVQQLRSRRVMRSANTVDAHRFQHLELSLNSPRVDSSAQRTEIVMITDAAYLQRFAVEEESFFDVELERANTERRFVAIDDLAALIQL